VEGRVPPEYFNDIKLPEFVTINFKQSALEAFLLMVKKKKKKKTPHYNIYIKI